MTLAELIDTCRLRLADESVGVRRSWEEMFRYALRYYPGHTPVHAFNPEVLAEQLSSSGMTPAIVEGYVKRWRDIITEMDRSEQD